MGDPIQLDPVELPGARGLDDDEEERRRAQMRALEGLRVPDIEVPPVRSADVMSQVMPAGERALTEERARLTRQAAEAQGVGDEARSRNGASPDAFGGLAANLPPWATEDLPPARPQPQRPNPAPSAADRARQILDDAGVSRDLAAIRVPAPPGAPPASAEVPEVPQVAQPATAPEPPGVGRSLGAPSALPPWMAAAPAQNVAAATMPEALAPRQRLAEALRARQAQSLARPIPSALPPVPAGPAESTESAKPPGNAPPDFTGADWSDALRRVLFALGSGLRAYGGDHTVIPFRSERAQIEQRMREAEERKAEEAGQRSRLDLAREQLGMQRADREADRSLQERTLALRESMEGRRASAYEQNARTLDAIRQAQMQRYQTEADRAAALTDPSSDVSNTARLSLRTALAGYPSAARARLAQQLGIDEGQLEEHLRGLSAEQADSLAGRLPAMFRDLTNRRGGAQGAGGGGASSETAEAIAERAHAAGLSDTQIASYGRDRRRLLAEIEQREGEARRGEERGTEILPGVRTSIALPAGEATALRSGIATAGGSAANLRGLGEIQERHGGIGARISPDAQAAIVPRLTVARGMVAQLGNTGVINPAEVDTINGALPDPGSLTGMTFGTFGERMQTWQRLLEDNVRAQLAARGVDDAGISRAIATIRAGSWSQGGGHGQDTRPSGAQSHAEPRVPVRSPSGQIGSVPRSQLAAAQARGFTVVEGD